MRGFFLINHQSSIINPSPPLVSVIVCSLNGARVLPACLASLRAQHGVSYEVIVVDNGSTDATPELVRRDFDFARLIQTGRNLGFAGGNNVGMQAARGEVLVLLNDDTEAPPDWLEKLAVPFARDARVGAVGCKLVYPNEHAPGAPGDDPRARVIQHAGGVLLPNGNTLHLGIGQRDEGQWDTPAPRDYVTGAALALRRAALEQVGLLDPEFFPIYYEEVDLQRRLAEAGWTNWYEPAAWLVHHESQSQVAGSSQYYYRYTLCRVRFLAMHGFPWGKLRALRLELQWLGDVIRKRRLGPVVRAYWRGARNWPAWRADRETRASVPRLEPRGE